MADMQKFDTVSQARAHVRQFERNFEERLNGWPEVPRGFWITSDEQPADPMNSEKRVLFEMMLVLVSTAAIAAAIYVFTGGLAPV
jgi:hypothetical protein